MKFLEKMNRVLHLVFDENVVREIHYTNRNGKHIGYLLRDNDWEILKFLSTCVSALVTTMFIPVIQPTGNLFLITNYNLWWVDLIKYILKGVI